MGCAASVELHHQLWGAIAASDAAGCKKAISSGASPDVRNADGETALHLAVKTFNSDVFRLLLDASHDKEATDAHGQTPLHRAVVASPEAVAILMAHGADLRRTTPAGDTALHIAASVAENRGFGSVNVRMLLQRGAPVDERNVRGATALHCAAAQCAPDTVRLLLESQANPRVVDSGGNLPLHLAAGAIDAKGGNETRGLQTLRLLLLAGSDTGQRNAVGATPVALAGNPVAAAMLEHALEGTLPRPFSRASLKQLSTGGRAAWGGGGSWDGGSSSQSPSLGGASSPGSSAKEGTAHSGADAVALAMAVGTPKQRSLEAAGPMGGSSGRGRSSGEDDPMPQAPPPPPAPAASQGDVRLSEGAREATP